MIYFNSDYLEGAHSAIMARLAETNMMQTIGYSEDEICASAREKIKAACQAPDADVHFLVGGTQTNTTVIASILRPWQGVLSAVSGHINCHETGAIEAGGHKVLTLPHDNGKITAEQLRRAIDALRADGNYEHIVQPGMVYISQPTEYGTLYTKAELEAISAVCRERDLPLMLDGARLAYALAADETLTLADYARCCDVFTVGGTKCGLLFGEAVVITRQDLKPDFRNIIKQRGGMLAKGRLLGVQFETMFEDGLYLECGRRGVDEARRIRGALLARGLDLAFDSPTNQLFVLLTPAQRDQLQRDFAVGCWDTTGGERDAYRLCTSWATKPEAVDELLAAIAKL